MPARVREQVRALSSEREARVGRHRPETAEASEIVAGFRVQPRAPLEVLGGRKAPRVPQRP